MKATLKYFYYEILSYILPKQFYRVSVKALIWNEDRTKFLILQEVNGLWEVPGGGLDWGESPKNGLRREIQEETGLEVISVSPSPACFTTAKHHRLNGWFANVTYEAQVKNTEDLIKSDECIAIDWVTPQEAIDRKPALNSVSALGEALLKIGGN